MRTTVDLNDALFRRLKKKAAERGESFKNTIERALRAYVDAPPPNKKYRLQWHTEKGKLRAGVNLDDRSALLDLMDER